jgi:hypothetical protein
MPASASEHHRADLRCTNPLFSTLKSPPIWRHHRALKDYFFDDPRFRSGRVDRFSKPRT